MKFQLVIFLVLIASCGYKSTEIPPGAGASGGSSQGASTLDFATTKSQVFETYCLRCHSAAGGNKGGINLESFGNVKPLVQRIQSAVDRGSMPPSGGLPSTAKSQLTNWIQAGAPEFSAGSTTPNPAPGPSPTPMPCEDHHSLVEDGVIIDLDSKLSFDVETEALKQRHDDCDKD